MLPQNTNIEILLRCQFSKVVFWSSPGGLNNYVFAGSNIEFLVVLGGLKNWLFGRGNVCKNSNFEPSPRISKIALLSGPNFGF